MFIKKGQTWYGRGEQRSRGLFLLAACADERDPSTGLREIRAIARTVKLVQSGHYMVGAFRVSHHKINISGGLGQDGLPCDRSKIPDDLWEHMIKVPDDVARAFWTSDDTVTNGYTRLGDWARANEAALIKPLGLFGRKVSNG